VSDKTDKKKRRKEAISLPTATVKPALWRGLSLLVAVFCGYFGLLYLRDTPAENPLAAWVYGAVVILGLPWLLRWVLVGYSDGVYCNWSRLAGWLFRDPRPYVGGKRIMLFIALAGVFLYPLAGMVVALVGEFSLRLLAALIVLLAMGLINALVLERYNARVCRAL
jgi:hypothetical protein